MYKLTNGSFILRLADNASIPTDEANCDYQCYLQWVTEGNTPEPADVPDPRISLMAQLSALNGADKRLKADREFKMEVMEREAGREAERLGSPTTAEGLLAASVYYQALAAERQQAYDIELQLEALGG